MGDAKHLNSLQSNSISLLSSEHQKDEVAKSLLQAVVAHPFNPSSLEVEDGDLSEFEDSLLSQSESWNTIDTIPLVLHLYFFMCFQFLFSLKTCLLFEW